MRSPADLDPSTDQARQWLSEELARSEYHDTRSLFSRLMDWIGDRLADLQRTQGTGGVSLPPVVISLLVVVLVGAVLYLLTRIRVESKTVRQRATLLGNTVQAADQLRRDGERALAEGRFGDAVLAWTRALARDADQRTLLPDARSMTAHEVGTALRPAFPDHADAIYRTMDIFDAVAYGDRPASRDDALLARSTDEALRSAKPVLQSSRSGQAFGDARDGDGMPAAPAEVTTGAGSAENSSVWMTGIGS
jgi:hypothetical protein